MEIGPGGCQERHPMLSFRLWGLVLQGRGRAGRAERENKQGSSWSQGEGDAHCVGTESKDQAGHRPAHNEHGGVRH